MLNKINLEHRHLINQTIISAQRQSSRFKEISMVDEELSSLGGLIFSCLLCTCQALWGNRYRFE